MICFVKYLLLLNVITNTSCWSQIDKLKIVNDFVTDLFELKQYKTYQNQSNILMDLADSPLGPVLYYEKVMNDSLQINYKHIKWGIGKVELKRLKKKLANSKKSLWKKDNFNTPFFSISSTDSVYKNLKKPEIFVKQQ